MVPLGLGLGFLVTVVLRVAQPLKSPIYAYLANYMLY